MPRIIPNVVDTNEKGVDYHSDIFSRLLKERIIFVTGEIDEKSADIICAQLLALQLENNNAITLYINSPGGLLYEALSIIDVMDFISRKVRIIRTIGCGLVASGAALILSCGTKTERFATKNCRIMVHQPLGGFRGQVTDIQIHANEGMLLKQVTTDILASKTGKSFAEIEKTIDRDKFMSCGESIEFGIVDAQL